MLTTGQVLIERYRIEGMLGSGGSSAVYLAHHLELHLRVAIKEWRIQALTEEHRTRLEDLFRQEALILHRLEHKNLPRVLDFFMDQNRSFLVMEYVEGETLQSIAQREMSGEEQVLEWTRQLCEVLEYLHGQKPPLIFRDLKPANVMLRAWK